MSLKNKWVFCWVAPLSAVFVSTFPLAADSLPSSSHFPYPLVPSPGERLPLCYMETNEGEILNLNRLCGGAKHPGDRPLPQSATNGEEPCYFVDENGLRCPVSDGGQAVFPGNRAGDRFVGAARS